MTGSSYGIPDETEQKLYPVVIVVTVQGIAHCNVTLGESIPLSQQIPTNGYAASVQRVFTARSPTLVVSPWQ